MPSFNDPSKQGKTNWQINDTDYHQWINSVERPWREALTAELASADYVTDARPLISVLMPTYETPLQFLCEAIESLINQQYSNWQLCIADDASTEPRVKETIQSYVARDRRISAVYREINGGIATATNDALKLARGEYVALLDHDDVLPDHSLLLVAKALSTDETIQILYTDSDNLNSAGERCNPFFKPDWNYDLFLGQNYLNHLTVYRADLMRRLGGIRTGLEGSQDYDLALRAVEQTPRSAIKHISHVLYHWRIVETSVSRSNMGSAVRAARIAIREHLQRTGQNAQVCSPQHAVIYNRVCWSLPDKQPSVAVFIYGDTELQVADTLNAIQRSTQYYNYTTHSILIGSGAVDSDRVAAEPCGNQLGLILNKVVQQNHAELLCFVIAGLRPQQGDWLNNLAAQALRESVGVVACKVLSAQSCLKGGPMVVGIQADSNDSSNNANAPLANSFDNACASSKGYFGRLALDQEVSVVDAMCMVCRRDVYLQYGGFNPTYSHLALLGADLSLKCAGGGLLNLWTANSLLQIDKNSACSLLDEQASPLDARSFQQSWHHSLQHDPYYNLNLNLNRQNANYSLPAGRRSIRS